MTGGSVPEQGGIVLSLEKMNRIIEIDPVNLAARVQPGLITGEFQEEIAKYGLYYPPEPASAEFSTIGGNVAESAGGLGCVKYGLTKHFIEGIEFVTSGGEIIRTGSYSSRQAPFDTGAILAGSEGTLGIITEIALRLVPLPENRLTFRALFHSLENAARASNAVITSGVRPSVLEFLDRKSIDAVSSFTGISLPENTGAILIGEIEDTAEDIERTRPVLLSSLEGIDIIEVKTADTPSERAQLWKLRKSISPAISRVAPLKINEDICVPLSAIPEMCAWVEQLAARKQVNVVTFGHSGDGNIHVNFMTDPENREEFMRVKEAVTELFGEAVKRGGTLSGEHGIGIAKRPYIEIALDQPTISFQKKIKKAFDPENILNPGKIFPE
jgi:glycolate oxidase